MSIKLLIDGCNGIYIPKRFYENYDGWLGMPNDIDDLSDPDNEFYWDVWDDVLDNAYYIDSEGNKWRLIVMRKTKSTILEAVHDTAKGLHKAGVLDQVTLREFDRLCLLPIEPLGICGHIAMNL